MKTLIVYATKYGCAEKCGKILAEKLSGAVDLCNLKETKDIDLDPYGKIIIGGSIYAGKVQKEVTRFCLDHGEELLKKNLGLFICGMLQDKAEEELEHAFGPELIKHALVHEFLGGEFRFKRMNFVERLMVKMVTKGDKNLPSIDMSKDLSAISEEKILKLARIMNQA